MRELRFYSESALYAAKKKLLILLGVLPAAFVFFVLILKVMGERNDFVRTCTKLSIPVGIIAFGLIAGAIFMYYKYRSSFVITVLPQGTIQFVVRNSNGAELTATGRWTYHALYTKHYYKYGTYQKQLYLILFCNDQLFCMLRHEVAAAFSPPEGFREVGSEPSVGVPTYFTNRTPDVHALVREMQRAAMTQQIPTYGSR